MNKHPLIRILPWLCLLSLIWLGSGVQADGLEERRAIEKAKEYNTLVVKYLKKGQYQEALPWAEKAWKIRTKILGEKDTDTLSSLNNLAQVYHGLGRYDEALPLFKQSYRLFEDVLGDKDTDTLVSLANLAEAYRSLGRLDEALPLSEQAYRLFKEALGDKDIDTLASLNNLAVIYKDLGRLDEALPLFERSYRFRKEVLSDKHPGTLTSLNNLAFIYQVLGRFDQALPYFKNAYNFRKEVLGEKHPDTLQSLNNLAAIYRASGRFTEAFLYFEQGYRSFKEVLGEQHPDTLQSLNNLAAIYQALGGYDEALPYFEHGYRLSKEVLGDKHPNTLISLNNLAFLYAKKNEIDKAINYYELFIDGVETLRSRGDLSAENRQTLFEKWTNGYYNLSLFYLTKSRLHDAFRIAELTKARTLIEAMTLKLAIQQAGLSSTEQQQFQTYQGQQAVLTDRIAKEGDLNKRIELEAQKNQLVTQIAEFHRSLLQKYPKYADLNKIAIMEASQGAPLIPEDSLLISFLLSKDNQLLVFTLDHTGDLQAKDLGKIPNLESRLNDYRTLLATRPYQGKFFWRLADGSIVSGDKPAKEKLPQRVYLSDRIDELGRELAKDLLVPIQDRLNTKRHWIISPDGALALIPFETLILKDQPVIADHDLSYVQSLSVLALLKHREQQYQKSSRQELFALGAPRYERPDQSSVARGECNKAKGLPNINLDVMLTRNSNDPQRYVEAFKALGIHWCNLPGAQRELDNLTKLFADSQPLIIQGEQANEGRLKQRNGDGTLAHYQYLMFSTHGYLSNESPALSSLVLDQLQTTPENDGYITAGEWVGYTMKSDLMVLSACQTGEGKVQRGEGVLGLPYALYVAGNKNTLLTLWTVIDDSTAEFTTRFFKKLKDGKGKVSQIDALMATKREFLKEEKYRLPVYWAAFVLYGV